MLVRLAEFSGIPVGKYLIPGPRVELKFHRWPLAVAILPRSRCRRDKFSTWAAMTCPLTRFDGFLRTGVECLPVKHAPDDADLKMSMQRMLPSPYLQLGMVSHLLPTGHTSVECGVFDALLSRE